MTRLLLTVIASVSLFVFLPGCGDSQSPAEAASDGQRPPPARPPGSGAANESAHIKADPDGGGQE